MPDASREEIDRLIAAGNGSRVRILLAQFWRESPLLASASFVVSRFERLRSHLELTNCKIAILRSFTVEPMVPLLRAIAFVGGIDLDVRVGDFNTFAQDILDAGGWLYAFEPDVVILAVQTRDVAPALWSQFADLDGGAVSVEVGRTISQFEELTVAFRSRSAAHLIIHSLETPEVPSRGLSDSCIVPGQADAIEQINARLRQLARSSRNVHVLDYNALIARRGHANWHDERKWLMSAMPIAAGELIHLAREWVRFLHPITGRISKVLAVDLDNTLWGGVIGEEGIEGIQLGGQYPGAAFRSLQRAMLDLHHRGILLAICSKNNLHDAMEVIEKHPEMLLRPKHFAAVRINWSDKATQLREIAGELNVGIDSIAFLDDNPVEREWIAGQIPEVIVIDLPADPLGFAGALRESPFFERLTLTDEDAARGKLYGEQQLRAQLKDSVPSLEDFYRSLQMQIRVEPISDRTIARAAQLTQKTNQFNLTTRRYSEAELSQAMKESKGFTLQVIDRFGDNGIVGVSLLQPQSEFWEITTFLLSCRVIGRTVETAFLAALATHAKAHGARRIGGWFRPTKKNAPAADFYRLHGFSKTKENDRASFWEMELASGSMSAPAWISTQGTDG